MELVVMLLLTFPLGFFVPSRAAAYVAYIAVQSFVFTFQTMYLMREWVGGSTEAFDKDPQTVPWSYGLVNLLIYAAGFGLVTLGHHVAARRRRRSTMAVELSA
jgi:hypothetical protein